MRSRLGETCAELSRDIEASFYVERYDVQLEASRLRRSVFPTPIFASEGDVYQPPCSLQVY